jgi:hypothetical protein
MAMGDNSKISGRDTYVFDKDELEELDELSLTSVMTDATESIRKMCSDAGLDVPEDLDVPEEDEAFGSGDTSINALLEDPVPSADYDSDYGPASSQNSDDASDDLIDPSLLFPDEFGK